MIRKRGFPVSFVSRHRVFEQRKRETLPSGGALQQGEGYEMDWRLVCAMTKTTAMIIKRRPTTLAVSKRSPK